MKLMMLTVATVAAIGLSACCYRPCPRPCAPIAPSYVMPACAPSPYMAAVTAQPVKRMIQAPAEK